MNGRDGMDSLIESLKDESPSARQAAHDALGVIDDPRITDRLMAVLRDKKAVHNGVLLVLTNLVRRDAMGPLVTALTDQDPDVRRNAETALRCNVELRHHGHVADAARRQGLFRDTAHGEVADEGFFLLVFMLLHQGRIDRFDQDPARWRKWWAQNSERLPSPPAWIAGSDA